MGILFGLLLLMLLINLPVVFALGMTSVVWILTVEKTPLILIVHRMFRGLDSFPLIAMPFFILAGSILDHIGATRRLMKLAEAVVGHLKGGLAHINVVASMFFAGITGSAVADTSAIGSLLIPAMIKQGYTSSFSVAVTAVSSVIGVIIPPSILMVLYAVAVELSVGKMLLAGAIPGILLGFSQMGVITWYAHKEGYPTGGRFELLRIFKTGKEAVLSMMVIVIIVGGIYGGIFTPTEAAVVAVLYTLFLGFVVYRNMGFRDLPKIFIQAGLVGASGVFILTTTNVFAWIITSENVPQKIINTIFLVTNNKILILFFLNLALLICGTFLPGIAAIIVLAPILHPIGLELGMNPIHFGVIVVLNLSIGLVSPPVGPCLFVSCAIGNCSLSSVIKPLIPLYLASVVALLLVTFVPWFSMAIPDLMGAG
jgi:C4-dicarboxylate transporter DctM subunit